jgi:hypothetical protein
MRLLIAAILLVGLANCQRITEEDKVRKARREYVMSQEFTVDSADKLSIELKVQNKSGGQNLQEITVIAEAVDADGNIFWTKQFEVDVTGLGEMASKTEIFSWTVPESNAKMDGLKLYLAPDGPDSDYKTYKEFVRVM